MSTAYDSGVNFFDSANIYSKGKAEEILGKLIRDCRDELVITSKVCSAMGPGGNDRGLSRRHIMMQVEGSLRRLATDRPSCRQWIRAVWISPAELRQTPGSGEDGSSTPGSAAAGVQSDRERRTCVWIGWKSSGSSPLPRALRCAFHQA